MAAGMTVAGLARAVHVARPTMSLWESGRRRPARHYWPALATALNIRPAQVAQLFPGHPPARMDAQPLPGLAAQRRRRGLTQRAVAEHLGVAPSTLAMWETRHVPVPPETADHLARLLHTDPTRLTAPSLEAVATDPRPLRRYRRRLGLSQREAATYLGISLASLARYEAGDRQPSVTTARAMAAIYRLPFEDIVAACRLTLPPIPTSYPWSPEQVAGGLHAARLAAGLTAVALGRAVSRSGQVVHAWETGRRRPDDDTCRRLEFALHLAPGTVPRK